MDDLLTTARMARQLGISCDWLREQADAGKIPCLKIGDRYFFSAAAVRDAMAVMAARPSKGVDHAE